MQMMVIIVMIAQMYMVGIDKAQLGQLEIQSRGRIAVAGLYREWNGPTALSWRQQ